MEFGMFEVTCICIAWILIGITVGFTFYVYNQTKDQISDTNKNYLLTGAVTSASSLAFILLAVFISAFWGGSDKNSKDLLLEGLNNQNAQDEETMRNLRAMSEAQNEKMMPMRSRRSGWCRPKNSSRRNMENIFQDESPDESVVLEMD